MIRGVSTGIGRFHADIGSERPLFCNPVNRKADLRAFVLSGADGVAVWPSGLTRFSRIPDSFVVNSSQGGGFKDTWVMAS